MKNAIIKIETKPFINKNEMTFAVFIDLDIIDKNQLNQFINEIIYKFYMQTMISHPETSLLFISISGIILIKIFFKNCGVFQNRCKYKKLKDYK